jgi:membrane protein required for colicin V production
MWIDVVFLVVLLYGFWQGWNQGIIGTILNLSIYAFGIVMAFKMAPVTSVLMERIFDSSHPLMFVGGFVANILVIYLIVHLATNNIENVLQRAYLGVFNRLAGGIIIGGFYVLLFSVIIWFLSQANGLSNAVRSESKTFPILEPMPGYAKGIAVRLQPLVADSWVDFNTWMNKAQNFGLEKTEGKGRVYEVPEPKKNQPLFETAPKKSAPSKPLKDSNPIEE